MRQPVVQRLKLAVRASSVTSAPHHLVRTHIPQNESAREPDQVCEGVLSKHFTNALEERVASRRHRYI